MECEQEIVSKRKIWCSTDEDEDDENENQNQKNELKLLCFKWDLEIIRNKGYQKPRFTIYLLLICSIASLLTITLLNGYATNWNKIAYFPLFFAQIAQQLHYFYEFRQSSQILSQKTKFYKFLSASAKIVLGSFSTFSVVYVAIFIPLFNSPVLYMTAAYPLTFFVFFLICLASNYDDLPHTYFSNNNNNNNNNNINNNYNKQQNINIESKQKQYIVQIPKKSPFKLKIDQFDEWGALKQRLWTTIVTSIMFIDVISDVYYGYLLFQTYRALSTFLRISGIALIACSTADLFYIFFMLLFPGWVSHFAHTCAFVMELPNFVLTGISIWKVQQLIDQDIVEDNKSQQLAIFSIITTSLNALIHITYIMDRWAVKNAIEFIYQQ